jgi:hypothetical protein
MASLVRFTRARAGPKAAPCISEPKNLELSSLASFYQCEKTLQRSRRFRRCFSINGGYERPVALIRPRVRSSSVIKKKENRLLLAEDLRVNPCRSCRWWQIGNVLRKTCVDYCAETEDKVVIRDI